MATDDDGTAHHQYVKVEFGANNTQTKVTSSAGLPVTPDSGGFDVTNAGTFVTQATLQAGTAEVGKLAAGVAEIGNVKNSGTFAIQIVDPSFAVADGGALGEGVLIQGDDGTNRKNINVDATTGDVQVDVTNTITADLGATDTAHLAAIETAVEIIDNTVFVDDAPFTLTSSSVSMVGAIRDDQLVTLSAVEGDAVPLRVTHDGKLHTKAEVFDPGTIDGFGHLITGEYVNQIDIQFFRDTPANLTTVTVAGGGATSQVGGSGKWETSTAGTANAKSVTTQNTSYRSGSDIFALFTAAFTTGVANSFQRIGLYDTNDGFFFGFEGTSFGVTIRNATSDTTTASGSFSEDTLTGAAGSLFTRAGAPEAINTTKLNVFRVRFGWLGSGPIHFEILSPDDHWVTFHKILQPNLAAIASIENPDLPVTLQVDKNGADGTNIIMISSCWGAGISTGALPLNETLTDDVLAKINRNVIVGKTAGGSYVNVQTTNSGNLKVALDEYDGIPTGGGVESGSLRVTIANDSTGLISVDGTVTANAGTDLNTSALLTTTAHDAAFGTAGSADTQVRTVQGVASMTPLLVDATGQGDVPITLAGEAVVLGAGTAGIGKLTANDGVDIGDVDVTSISAGANLIGDIGLSGARTSGGTTIFRSIDLDEGALEVVKASAGQIYWMHVINLASAVRFVKIYNATSGTYGTGTPVLTFPIPTQGDSNGAGFTLSIPNGIAFATGISIGAGTGVADNDTGAPGANEVIVNLGFA